jgi:hypothetical protein
MAGLVPAAPIRDAFWSSALRVGIQRRPWGLLVLSIQEKNMNRKSSYKRRPPRRKATIYQIIIIIIIIIFVFLARVLYA